MTYSIKLGYGGKGSTKPYCVVLWTFSSEHRRELPQGHYYYHTLEEALIALNDLAINTDKELNP